MPARRPDAVHIARLTNGVLVSRQHAADGIPLTFTLSRSEGPLPPGNAKRLAAFMFEVGPSIHKAVLYKAGANVYHMVCRPTRPEDVPTPTLFPA